MTMQDKFFASFGATIPEGEVASKGGLSYLAAATAMNLSGRPQVDFVEFDGKPYLECMGGTLVAVDLTVPDTEVKQRMWLPVMDRDNQTLSLEKTTVTDINNSRQRCLVKALAAVHGVGMSLYLGFDGDGSKAVKALGVTPTTDLETVAPVVSTLKEGGQPYVEWGVGLAACRVTDPSFYWEVVMWEGKPYREVLGGVMVDVDTVYQNKRQRLSLPIMDSAFNPVPVAKASVFDWNKTVMRALTKCIAFNTGYGLSVYADDFGKEDAKTAAKGRKPAAKVDAPAPAAAIATAPAEAKAVTGAAPVPEAAPAVVATVATAPVVAATASPAPAVAPAPATNDAVTRFKGVMQSRRDVGGVLGLISLFDALVASTKFALEDKPACFAVLVPAVSAVAGPAEVTPLLAAIQAHKAMQYLDQSTRDMVAAKLTAISLEAGVAESDDALRQVPAKLVEAGVAVDAADVCRLAELGNVPDETMDLLIAVADLATA